MEGELCVILGGCDVTRESEIGGMRFDVRKGITHKALDAQDIRPTALPAQWEWPTLLCGSVVALDF